MGNRKRTGTVEGIPPGCDAIKSWLLLAPDVVVRQLGFRIFDLAVGRAELLTEADSAGRADFHAFAAAAPSRTALYISSGSSPPMISASI